MAHFSSVDINDGTNQAGTALRVSEGTILESQGTAAGTYTLSFLLGAGATVYDIIVHNIALWNAGTAATLKIGDAADDDGFFTGVNVKATDLIAGQSVSFAFPGGKQGADLDWTLVEAAPPTTGDMHVDRRYLSTTRTVSAVVTTTGTLGTLGSTRVSLLWFRQPSSDVEASTFVAT